MYPKILELRGDQPHREKWERYFYSMYLDELKRLSTEKVLESGQEMLDLGDGTDNVKTTE